MWIIPPPPAALIKNNKYTTVFLPPFFGKRIIVSNYVHIQKNINFFQGFSTQISGFFLLYIKSLWLWIFLFFFFLLIFLPSSQLKLDKTWLKTDRLFLCERRERGDILFLYFLNTTTHRHSLGFKNTMYCRNFENKNIFRRDCFANNNILQGNYSLKG